MSRIDGRAKKYNGSAIDYVMLFNWSTGNCIGTAKPDTAGNWKYYYFSNLNCGITYVADGCEPITHGAYQFNHIERAPFVDLITTVSKLDRGSNSIADVTLSIPSDVAAGDMLIISIMRRGNVAVSDNNSGAWVLGADSFGSLSTNNQGSSIYYRLAKANDAGKVIIVKGNYTDRLIVHLSVYRGKNKQLKVVDTISNPVRYDATYENATKNLAPIPHNGGFIVRSASKFFANTVGESIFEITNMQNLIPTIETPSSGVLRLQVAYKHLTSADVLVATAVTNSVSPNNVLPDVAIILDEV